MVWIVPGEGTNYLYRTEDLLRIERENLEKLTKAINDAFAEERKKERLKCAQIAAKECTCGMEFSKCHVAQEILLAREEQEVKGE